MKTLTSLSSALCLWLAVACPALAQSGAPAPPMPSPTQYTANGADTCLECHDDEGAAYSAKALFKSRHAQRGDKRTPFGPGGLQCESCHGPGALHARNKRASAIVNFKADSKAPLAQRNQVCLTCHQASSNAAWHASAHERGDVACTDCHKVHREHGDPMLAKASASETCLACHKSQRADFHKASTHPVSRGKMGCSDCHTPHGSSAPAMLAKATVNQTCFSCHADKRGPVLWEHAPVTEDCSLCHTPHGSVRPAMLTKSAPLLCQQCHSPVGHPSVPLTSRSLPGGPNGATAMLVGNSCTNCHTKVHGSNHPSGAKLLR